MENTFKTNFKSFYEMLELLPNDNACRLFLEDLRWNGKPVCPHCGSINGSHYKLKTKGEFTGLYKCKDCRERFTVTVGTMFEGSHVPLRKWFIAIYIFTSHKKGISSIQLGKDLGITQKSAWFVLHRLRNTFEQPQQKFDGITEIDESWLGGADKNKHANKKTGVSGAHTKTAVLGIRNRKDGIVKAQVVPNTKAETLVPIIKQEVIADSIVMTDENRAYVKLHEHFSHGTVNHSAKEYVNGQFHTNGIENFWSHLKRGIDGIYHQCSTKHLQSYVNEFSFRYNSRKTSESARFIFSLQRAEKRLTYKELINN